VGVAIGVCQEIIKLMMNDSGITPLELGKDVRAMLRTAYKFIE
jgi:hypothetical protein